MKNYILILVLLLIGANTTAQDLVWAKDFGGPNSTSRVVNYGMRGDQLGNYYSWGTFEGTIDFDPGPGVNNMTAIIQDCYIQKFDNDGDLIWVKRFVSGGNPGGLSMFDIAVDDTGTMYAVGMFENVVDFDPDGGVVNLTAVSNSDDAFILKLDSAGSFQWVKQIGAGDSESGRQITLDATGNIYVSGDFEGTVDFDPGGNTFNLVSTAFNDADVFVLKLDSNGDFVWAHKEGGLGNELPQSMEVDNIGNCYLFTNYQSSRALIKLDNSGNNIWTKPTDIAVGQVRVYNNDLYLSGSFSGTKDFDLDAGVQNHVASGTQDGYVLKLNLSGGFVWFRQVEGTGFTTVGSPSITIDNEVYVAGTFNGTCDVDPGPQQYNFTAGSAMNERNSFILKLNSSGDFIWGREFGNKKGTITMSLVVNNNELVCSGHFRDTVDFDPNIGIYNLSTLTTNALDGFILKLSAPVNIYEVPDVNSGLLVYPNPASKQINVTVSRIIERIDIVDVLGRNVLSVYPYSKSCSFTLDLPGGLYNISVLNDSVRTTQKLIINP